MGVMKKIILKRDYKMEDPNRKWHILFQNKIPSWYFKEKLLMLNGYLIWKKTFFFLFFFSGKIGSKKNFNFLRKMGGKKLSCLFVCFFFFLQNSNMKVSYETNFLLTKNMIIIYNGYLI